MVTNHCISKGVDLDRKRYNEMFENLFSNLLVISILFALFVIIYCRVKNQTLLDVLRDIREFMRSDIENE